MSPPPPTPPLEAALEHLAHSLASWRPEGGRQALEPITEALRAVNALFDPRRNRSAAALCVCAMKMVEQVAGYRCVPAQQAMEVVAELSAQLQEGLAEEVARERRRGAPELIPGPLPAGAGLKLRLVDDMLLGELMSRLGMLSDEDLERALEHHLRWKSLGKRFGEVCIELGLATAEQIDSALRLQARGRGRVQAAAEDPWGGKPL